MRHGPGREHGDEIGNELPQKHPVTRGTCGEDAFRTAEAAVKDANYVIGTLPEARKQGGKTYERKDPTFQDR